MELTIIRFSKWQCGNCKKLFNTEKELDKHINDFIISLFSIPIENMNDVEIMALDK